MTPPTSTAPADGASPIPEPESRELWQRAFGRYSWRLLLLVLLAGYSYGWLSLRVGLPPSGILDRAAEAVTALERTPDDNTRVSQFDGSGVLKAVPEKMAPGMTLVMAFRGGSFRALLLDTKGHVHHEWHILYSQLWKHPPQEQSVVPDNEMNWHGAHLFANGDLVFNLEGDGFPYGGGTVRIDRNSKVLWKLPLNTNHSLDVADDGTLWVANQRWVGQGQSKFPHFGMPHYEDSILQVSPDDGKVLREINLLGAIVNSDYRGLLPTVQGGPPDWRPWVRFPDGDPTHLNSVDVLSSDIAPEFPFKAGDILVSLRAPSALCVIDKDTGLVKWAMSGPSVMQHSARFTRDGHIIMLDNAGGSPGLDSSRVIEIDPMTQKIVWSYDHDLDTPIRGTVRILPNGNVLIAETERGRVLEVTRSHEIVWEWVNGLDRKSKDGKPLVGIVEYAQRVPPSALGFLTRSTP